MFSLSLSFGQVFDLASKIVNGLLPVYMVPFGLGLAFLILGALTKVINRIRVN